MSKLVAVFSFLLVSGCLAWRQHPEQNECQIRRLNTLKPDNRIESEGGLIETWNPNNKPFRCAGVALSRCTLNRNALRRPFYSNAPQEIYIQQGSGLFGMIFPGCPQNFEEPQREGQRPQDRHQKVHHFKEGDLIAVPTGVAFWIYNPRDTPVIAVSLLDVNSNQNQLDQTPRRFYLAGNQEQEFIQYQQDQDQEQEQEQQGRGRHHQSQSHHRGEKHQQGQEQENEGGNVFSGFSENFLQDALNVNRDIVRNLQGQNEEQEKGEIVTVKGGLSVTIPPSKRQQQRPQEEEQEDEDEEQEQGQGQWPPRPRGRDQDQDESPRGRDEGRRSRGGDSNGIDENICTIRLRHNIGQSSSPDIYNPQAGSIKTSTSLDFPALRFLRLSAQFGTLRKNAMFVPHYTLNANSIIYALQGRAQLQVVNCNGERVFDDNLEEGQVLIVPQNFVVAAKSQSDNFKYVSFKTNDQPMTGTLAGRNSLLNAMPEEVIQNTFNLRRQQARQIKQNNRFNYLVPPNQSQSQRRDVA